MEATFDYLDMKDHLLQQLYRKFVHTIATVQKFLTTKSIIVNLADHDSPERLMQDIKCVLEGAFIEITRRSRKALKPIKESQPEKEHEVEECKPGHLGEHTELTDLRGNDNECSLKVSRPRKPLARMEEFSNSNSLGSNRPYLTRLASKKHATEATIKGTEYPNKVAVNMQDSVNPKKTRGWQTLKQDSQISPQRSKIKPGPRVSPRRGGLKRRESSQAQLPATLKKLHFR